MSRKQTPSQTVGPFFSLGLTPGENDYDYPGITSDTIARSDPEGEQIEVTGRVLDGNGEPVADALIESWQANTHGRYRHPGDADERRRLDPNFVGFARTDTSHTPDHSFSIHTIKPGATGDGHAPHLTVTIFMRGGLNHLYTRIYFEDEGPTNETDPVLAVVPADRRHTLIATREQPVDGNVVYRFDIHVQGSRETVFLDV